MSSVLVRHYPALAPMLRTVRNAFAPWPIPEEALATGRGTGT
jgi:hypothetical protein